MKNNKYFILLFGYTRIQLFTEINGKITNIDFANGKNKLSNCVTFSYDREDLEFLPNGDPFEVNKNSSFSDYLDFAGYHFESAEAIEAIVASIIDNKLIPGLGKNDDIFLYLQAFQYESDKFLTSEEAQIDVCVFEKKSIKGHNLHCYDAEILYRVCKRQIKDSLVANALIGYPFLTLLIAEEEDGFSTIFAPTLERSVVEKVMEQYPLPTHIPEKLLRNIKNRILTSKLLGLPLPDNAIYQNRKVDIAKTNLSKHFDELLKEDAKLFLEKTDDVNRGPTLVFDFGMHPTIKESFLTRIANPIFVDKKDNQLFAAFMLRNMIVEHMMTNDPIFKKEAIKLATNGLNFVFKKFGNVTYYQMDFIQQYLKHFGKQNILSNIETKELKKFCQKLINY